MQLINGNVVQTFDAVLSMNCMTELKVLLVVKESCSGWIPTAAVLVTVTMQLL